MHEYCQRQVSLALAVFFFLPNIAHADVILGEETTTFHTWGRHARRAHNIRLAATAINGTRIDSEGIFSFNDVVGVRSTRRGFRKAPAILGGVPGVSVGGGVCQVSSTLFAAALRAGLSIKEVHGHSRYMSYIDAGLDATVTDGNKDLIFKNPFPFPVTIETEVGTNSISVRVRGERQGYLVQIEMREIHRQEAEVVRVVDESIPRGRFRLASPGTDGLLLERRVRRIPLIEGLEENTWTSRVRYRMTERVILVPET